MTAQELDLLKEKLLALRQDVFQRLRRLDDGWQELAEKDTEFPCRGCWLCLRRVFALPAAPRLKRKAGFRPPVPESNAGVSTLYYHCGG